VFGLIAVSNRLLCREGPDGFIPRIEKIAASGIDALILREKDLVPGEYEALARDVSALCAGRCVRFIPHTFINAAFSTGSRCLHLPWDGFRSVLSDPAGGSVLKKQGLSFGVSVHSVEEALKAQEQGASWVIAGHVFATDCKQGLDPRGPEFLAGVCRAVRVPVYAIGGVSEHTISAAAKTGAAGACIMSSLMQSPDPAAVVAELRSRLGTRERAAL
jgi:thiamine-phosphate pyrophosphorylase